MPGARLCTIPSPPTVLAVLLCLLLSTGLWGAAEEEHVPSPTFKSRVQVVLLDVVVTDRNNQPIKGLQKEDFEVSENGEPQGIASFEEHQGSAEMMNVQGPALPPHVFSNAPVVKPSGAINVLLLDALNTQFGDQASVRLQMIKYLQTIDPGPRLAIFTLGSQLQMVEGFTADPKALIEALNNTKWGGRPTTSPMLRTQAEDNMDQTILDRMSDNNGSNPGAPAAAIEALRRFQAEMKGTGTRTRVLSTLDALNELVRYLSGFQGRKNIIWFSGSFPNIEFPAGGERTRVDLASENGLGTEIKQTINMMAAAQIAVYPVTAKGVETEGMYQAEVVAHPMGPGVTPGEKVNAGQNQSLSNENGNRYLNQKAAFDIADNTGGKAFVDTNDLKDALTEAVHNGAYYYQLSYYPTDKRALGRYRHIKVRVKKGSYPTPYGVAYRRGYYEENEQQPGKVQSEAGDPLQPLMRRGLPDSTELIYNVRIVPSKAHPDQAEAMAGDNKALKPPATRYVADFIIPLDNLTFDIDSDGVRHGNVELALVAYDHPGEPLNWVVRSIRTTFKPNIYTTVLKTGVRLHQEIDIPNGDPLYLRTGIYDLDSNKAGTLEVPLREITNTDLDTKPPRGTVDTDPNVATSSGVGSAVRTPSPPLQARGLDSDQKGSVIALANAPSTTTSVPEAGALRTFSPEASGLKPAGFAAYCSDLAGTSEYSSALAKVCEFALAMRDTLPDITCDRAVRRYWRTANEGEGAKTGFDAANEIFHQDLITARVTYQGGQEYYSEVLRDGKPIDPNSPELSGTWSDGEFATILGGIFAPESKTEFRYERLEKVHSVSAFVFRFHVASRNNRLYSLHSGGLTWFPEYRGKLWIDARNLSLLRLQRETGQMPEHPISSMKTEITYSFIPLGDGTSLVLPTSSEVAICMNPLNGNGDNCGNNEIKFANWHKFRATTNIVMDPAH